MAGSIKIAPLTMWKVAPKFIKPLVVGDIRCALLTLRHLLKLGAVAVAPAPPATASDALGFAEAARLIFADAKKRLGIRVNKAKMRTPHSQGASSFDSCTAHGKPQAWVATTRCRKSEPSWLR